MLKITKMDFHRLLHSKVFYVSIIFLTVMAVALPMSGMSMNLDAMLGVAGTAANAGDDFMNSALGTGVVFMLLGIILTLFVCGDYSGGFAKNIFTYHSDAKDYIGGKMISMASTSAFLLIFYTIASVISLAFFGGSLALSGGVLGLVFFLLEKWLVSCALIAIVLLVNVATRNTALGILAGFLVATGGLSMGIMLLAEAFNLHWLVPAFSFTISGSSQLATLTFSGFTFLRIFLASVAWMVVCALLSRKVLKSKDVV